MPLISRAVDTDAAPAANVAPREPRSTGPGTVEPVTPRPPWRIERPASVQHWDDLTFVHWPVDPERVARLLPAGLRVDSHSGSAWVGLVPFRLRVGLLGLPPAPYLAVFPETNVRTYVIGPDGGRGVWFFSLDAARLAACIDARIAYRLPYYWARMRITPPRPDLVRWRYESTRVYPRAASLVVATPGEMIAAEEVSALEHFLTARWRLYARTRTGLMTARVEHPPWPLQRARLHDVNPALVRAACLGDPQEPPLVHFSGRLRIRVDRLRPVAAG